MKLKVQSIHFDADRKLLDFVEEKIDKLRNLSPIWDMMQEGVDLKSINWTGH